MPKYYDFDLDVQTIKEYPSSSVMAISPACLNHDSEVGCKTMTDCVNYCC